MTAPEDGVVELFAGPGGWSLGLRTAGWTGRAVGVELDTAACETARAAGHERVQADVAAVDPAELAAGMRVVGLIGSPVCPTWSMAGNGAGRRDIDKVHDRIRAFSAGRAPAVVDWEDDRTPLTAEPMRYIVELAPRWVALEQVPAVLPVWQHMAILLRARGYRVWCGILAAEEYGVPQTRRRAVLVASLDGPVGPPAPTHQEYRAGREPQTEPDLFGDPLPPPVSMAEALGWGLPDRPSWTVSGGGTETGGAEVFANAGCRAKLNEVVRTGIRVNDTENGTERDADQPAPTVLCSRPGNLRWRLRNNTQANASTRGPDEPAGTMFFGQRGNAVDFVEPETGESVRVSVTEAGVLQSFPPDYPWRGSKTAQYRQVGDAVPPLLAAHVLAPLVAAATSERVAS